MCDNSFFRRRQIWLPTFFGWLVLVAIFGTACLFAGRFIHPYLAPNAPVPAARLLVVEGWMADRELDQAVVAFRSGRYKRVVTTGGPIERWRDALGSSNYADLAATYLKKHGLGNVDVIAVPAPASAQDRTFLSAVKLREWMKQLGPEITAFDVLSSGAHARRSRMLYRMAFGPNIDIGVLSAKPSEYDEQRWWETSIGAKSVLGETIGLIWTVCCFYPPQPGSGEELWGRPRQLSQHR